MTWASNTPTTSPCGFPYDWNKAIAMIDINHQPERREPDKVLLVRPDHFAVVDMKNPYMGAGAVDAAGATAQWEALKGIYEGLREEGLLREVMALPGAEGLEDMVFCANQSLPFLDAGGRPGVVLSNMRHASRAREVPFFRDFYLARGYRVENVPDNLLLEGMGDCIFHPFRKFLWMGHGYRTSLETAQHLERILDMPVAPLRLVSPYFYHLDTCFLPLDEHRVALCPEAFDQDSLARIREGFRDVYEIDREEAVRTFCLNTHCLYSRERPVAVTPSGDHALKALLAGAGYRMVDAETSEFIKSGGSVFCMKMMYY